MRRTWEAPDTHIRTVTQTKLGKAIPSRFLTASYFIYLRLQGDRYTFFRETPVIGHYITIDASSD